MTFRKHCITLRVAFSLAIAIVALSVFGDGAEVPATGKYLMVLWDVGTPLPDGSPGTIKRVPEPDLPALGGVVLSKTGNQQIVQLPLARASELRRHEAVAYLQRLWQGESIEGWDETPVANVRMTPRTESDANLTWGPKTYAYDESGNIKSIDADQYTYDTAGRLIQAVVGGKTESFKYDPFGNLTEKAITGGQVVPIPVDGGSNRLVGPAYDAAGNVVTDKTRRAIVYDSLNMLTEIMPPVGTTGTVRRNLYDVNDEQIGTLLGANNARWRIRDFDGQVLREFRAVSVETAWEWVQDYIRGEGVLLAGESQTFSYNPSSYTYGGHRHYHLDHLGSVRLVTDDQHRSLSEHDYYAFGTEQTRSFQEEVSAAFSPDGMRFAGHGRDYLGLQNVESTDYLDNMHARYYDPNRGRFLSVDPTWSSSDLGKPQSWNRYSYVLNNPISRTDPDGRCSFGAVLFGAVGCFVEGAAKGAIQDYRDGKEAISAFRQQNSSANEQAMAGAVLALITAKYATLFMGGGEGAAASAEAKAATVEAQGAEAAMARGVASEARVLENMGLAKNTTKITSSDGASSIPDAMDVSKIVEVKDTKVVSNTRQIRIQREVAQATGREHVVVTGVNTKVTKPVEQNSTVLRREDLGPP